MSKKALVEAIVKHSSLSKDGNVLTKRAANKIIDVIFESMAVKLKDTGRVRVPQFGTFYLKQKPERTYYPLPREKGAKVERSADKAKTVPAHIGVGFKGSKDLKAQVKDGQLPTKRPAPSKGKEQQIA